MLSLDYVAGIIDGEGWIGFRKDEKYLHCVMAVSMTSLAVVKLLHEQFGGGLRLAKSKNNKHRNCYTWTVSHFEANSILTKIYPLLHIKQEQANLAIHFYNLNETTNKDLNDYFYNRMKLLNKRGVDEQ